MGYPLINVAEFIKNVEAAGSMNVLLNLVDALDGSEGVKARKILQDLGLYSGGILIVAIVGGIAQDVLFPAEAYEKLQGHASVRLKVEGIKLIRATLNIGLRDAKDTYEHLFEHLFDKPLPGRGW